MGRWLGVCPVFVWLWLCVCVCVHAYAAAGDRNPVCVLVVVSMIVSVCDPSI